MILRDISLSTPEENLLLDEVFLQLAEEEKVGETLRFWESPQTFIVLGRIGKIQEDVKVREAQKDKIPVLRRFSGGGTVVQGPGCLNYSLILSKKTDPQLNDIRRSYQFISEKIILAMQSLGVEAFFSPPSDLACRANNKKFSGNAQHRGRQFILHHGTLLYDFNLSTIERYLNIPKEMPEYRRGRPHADFVCNLALTSKILKKEIQQAWKVALGKPTLTKEEENRLKQFLATKKVSAVETEIHLSH